MQALGILQAAAVEPAAGDASDPGVLSDPHALLTYGSVLFYEGQAVLRGAHPADAEPVFRRAEDALVRAVRASDGQADSPSWRLLRGQCAYLLGDLNVYVFNDPAVAKALYEQTLRYVPTHAPAQGAVARMVMAMIQSHAERADSAPQDGGAPTTPR